LSRAQFRTFCLSSNSLLFPAFALHRTLRKNILGKKAWKRICRNRNQRPLLVSGSVVPPPSPSRRLVANKQKTPQHVLVKATIEDDHGMEESDDEDDEYSLPRPPGIEPTFETPPRPTVRRTSKLTEALTQKNKMLCEQCGEYKVVGAKDEHGSWFCTSCWHAYEASTPLHDQRQSELERMPKRTPIKTDVAGVEIGTLRTPTPVVGIAVASVVGERTTPSPPPSSSSSHVITRSCAQCEKICDRNDGANDENGSWYCKRCWVHYAEGNAFM